MEFILPKQTEVGVKHACSIFRWNGCVHRKFSPCVADFFLMVFFF